MTPLIVGTVALSIERALPRAPHDARVGVDGYNDADRVDLVLAGLRDLHHAGSPVVTLTRAEARELARLLQIATGDRAGNGARGPMSPR